MPAERYAFELVPPVLHLWVHVLSTSELLLGLSRHLTMYPLGPERAALGQIEFAGKLRELRFGCRRNAKVGVV